MRHAPAFISDAMRAEAVCGEEFVMNHLQHLGDRIPIPIRPDEDGFTGRECPNPNCEGYFKIEFGTGLKGENLPCHCPYCGHTSPHDQFWTKEQLEYAKSVALRKLSGALQQDLKKLERPGLSPLAD